MATTKNNYAHSCHFDRKEKLLLDEFISVLNNTEHMSMSDNDMLIYVHEKPRCYNNCEMVTKIKAMKGGKSHAC
jgi:site-specific DNA-adenine methylase